MQVTVYIPKEMEPGLLGLAEANGQTIQQVLLTPWKAERVLTKSVEERLDRIESKLDQLICGFGDRPVVNYEHKDAENPIQKRFREIREDVQEHVKSSNAKRELPDDEVLAKAQEKLEAVRAERKVETAKGPVKANAAMEGFFSPQPKSKWK